MIMDSGLAGGAATPDDEGPTPKGFTIFSVGERYPGTLPRMGCQVGMSDALEVVLRMESPSDKEVKAFRRMEAYGFYANARFPHGVLIWHFSDALSYETPLDPRQQETLCPDEVRAFLEGKSNVCRRVLLDQHGTVRAIGMLGLDWALVELLCEKWGDPSLDWSDYWDRYQRLIAGTSPQELWRGARKWKVKTHISAWPPDAPSAPVSNHCGTCEANREAVARLRGALKEAERREADLRQGMTALQSQAASLTKDKSDLKAQIASLSAGALQQEAAALKALIEERDFRILELEDAALERGKITKSMEGQIDDLGRRVKWLENRLRTSGIAAT